MRGPVDGRRREGANKVEKELPEHHRHKSGPFVSLSTGLESWSSAQALCALVVFGGAASTQRIGKKIKRMEATKLTRQTHGGIWMQQRTRACPVKQKGKDGNEAGFFQRKRLLKAFRGLRVDDGNDHRAIFSEKADVRSSQRKKLHCPKEKAKPKE